MKIAMLIKDFFSQYIKTADRVELAYATLSSWFIISLLLLSVIILVFIMNNKKFRLDIVLKTFFISSLFISVIFSLFGFDTYGTPVRFIAYLSDSIIMIFLCEFVGRLMLRKMNLDFTMALVVGFYGLIAFVLGVNIIFPKIFSYNFFMIPHLILGGFAVCEIIKTDFSITGKKLLNNLTPYIIFLCPVLFYFALPFVTESDIHTMSDVAGIMAQGKSVLNAKSGIPNEIWNIRYPGGLPAWSVLHARLLGTLITDAIKIIWIQTFVFFIFANIYLAKSLKLNTTIYCIFLFSFNLYYWEAFPGGQVQEMIAYSIGLLCLADLYRNGPRVIQPLFLILQTVNQPIVAIPFILAVGGTYLINFREVINQILKKNILFLIFNLFIFLLYIYLLSVGTENGNYFSRSLSKVEFVSFFSFIHSFNYSTYKLYYLALLLLPIAFWSVTKNKIYTFTLTLFLLAALSLDGISGYNSGGRFHAVFNVISLIPIVFSLLYGLSLRFVPISFHRIIWFVIIISWPLGTFDKFFIRPIPVFMTFTDRVAYREIMKLHLPDNTLLANLSFSTKDSPGGLESWPDGGAAFTWSARGASLMNTITARIGPHQLKHPLNAEFREEYRKCREFGHKKLPYCLKGIGFTHLFISSMSELIPKSFALKPQIMIGNSMFFDLRRL